jgi:hypothetical protein
VPCYRPRLRCSWRPACPLTRTRPGAPLELTAVSAICLGLLSDFQRPSRLLLPRLRATVYFPAVSRFNPGPLLLFRTGFPVKRPLPLRFADSPLSFRGPPLRPASLSRGGGFYFTAPFGVNLTLSTLSFRWSSQRAFAPGLPFGEARLLSPLPRESTSFPSTSYFGFQSVRVLLPPLRPDHPGRGARLLPPPRSVSTPHSPLLIPPSGGREARTATAGAAGPLLHG